MDLSRWKKGGYQQYLAHQERTASLQANREFSLAMLGSHDTTTLPEATLQLIANQYYAFLGDFSPEPLREKLLEDSVKFSRFLSVFARITREIFHLKKYRDLCAKETAAQLKQLDPNRQISTSERDMFLAGVQRLFGFKPDKPIGPPLSTLLRKSAKPEPPQQPAPPSPPKTPKIKPLRPVPK